MPEEFLKYLQGRDVAHLARDALDVLITYYIFYRVALVLKGTRAMQVVVGLALVFILYVFAQVLRLNTVLTLLSAVLSSALLIGVVVFQNDIRRGLMRVGAGARLSPGQSLASKLIDDVVEAATVLARHRTGAIITFEQEANLDEFVGSHTGHTIDAAVSPELLVSLFIPEALNKLHDGAVIIRDLRIAKAGVFFPMPEGRVTDESFGSRHRAALGITEETDAVVVVVGEERGSISFCFNGNIIANLDGPRLRAALEGIFAPKRRHPRRARIASLWGRWMRREEPARTIRTSLPELESRAAPTRPAQTVPVRRDKEKPPSPLRKKKAEAADGSRDRPKKQQSAGEVGEPRALPLRKKRSDDAPDTDRSPSAPAPLRKRRSEDAIDNPRPSQVPPPVPLVPSAESLRTPLRHLVATPMPGAEQEPPSEPKASGRASHPPVPAPLQEAEADAEPSSTRQAEQTPLSRQLLEPRPMPRTGEVDRPSDAEASEGERS